MKLPKPMQLVTLFRMQDEVETMYPVRVQEIGADRIVLDIPLAPKGYPVRIPAGEALRIGYIIQHRAFYLFSTVVLELEREEIPHLIVARPRLDQIRKVQRRHFFRVPVSLLGKLLPSDGVEVPIKVSDLSGGGFSFHAGKPIFQLDQMLKGVIQLPGPDEVAYEAQVKRVEFVEENKQYLHGCEFILLAEGSRDKIVKYCLERQAKLIKFSP